VGTGGVRVRRSPADRLPRPRRQVRRRCDVGGIRVSHLSHIDKPLTIALTVTRGKRAPYVVQPLPADTRQDDLRTILERAHKARTKNELRPLYKAAVELGADEKTAAAFSHSADALAETLPNEVTA
jgi:hypothetical protein